VTITDHLMDAMLNRLDFFTSQLDHKNERARVWGKRRPQSAPSGHMMHEKLILDKPGTNESNIDYVSPQSAHLIVPGQASFPPIAETTMNVPRQPQSREACKGPSSWNPCPNARLISRTSPVPPSSGRTRPACAVAAGSHPTPVAREPAEAPPPTPRRPRACGPCDGSPGYPAW
jgi:hypothetical protein